MTATNAAGADAEVRTDYVSVGAPLTFKTFTPVADAYAKKGEIDLALHTSEAAPSGLHQQALFTERYVLAGRAGHPRRPGQSARSLQPTGI